MFIVPAQVQDLQATPRQMPLWKKSNLGRVSLIRVKLQRCGARGVGRVPGSGIDGLTAFSSQGFQKDFGGMMLDEAR